MLKVGLTGGIGSGKSTVAKIFESLGIPVYDADKEAKQLMETDEGLKAAIKKTFGADTYKKEKLDRELLASIVFNDNYKLDLLNSFVHPATIRHASKWIKGLKDPSRKSSPYIIKEAALIFEAGSAGILDFVIGVFAPLELRIKRVMNRDGLSRDEILKRINRQIKEEIKMRLCDIIITNDEQTPVLPQVMEIHRQLISRIA
jgi:dephospho-CoA kinase